MQRLNDIVDSKILEQYNTQEKRSYLGASSIGDECIRKVQLQYMQKDQKISAKQIRTFDIGHCLEDLVIKWLRIAGFDLKTRNEKLTPPHNLFFELNNKKINIASNNLALKFKMLQNYTKNMLLRASLKFVINKYSPLIFQ